MSESGSEGYMTDEYMSRLTALGKSINAGDLEQTNKLIGELTTLRESSLFQEVCKLTREIHDFIKAFGDDQGIAELTQQNIPDARERLNYIITNTEKAAHRTISAAEETVKIVNSFDRKAKEVREHWRQFKANEIAKAEFLLMSGNIDQLLSTVDSDTKQVRDKMSEIMIAQDYQDLTGQMIGQVISIVQQAEEKLVRLVAITGANRRAVKVEVKPINEGVTAHGPQLPTADKKNVATNQDEVDDLLASLGF